MRSCEAVECEAIKRRRVNTNREAGDIAKLWALLRRQLVLQLGLFALLFRGAYFEVLDDGGVGVRFRIGNFHEFACFCASATRGLFGHDL